MSRITSRACTLRFFTKNYVPLTDYKVFELYCLRLRLADNSYHFLLFFSLEKAFSCGERGFSKGESPVSGGERGFSKGEHRLSCGERGFYCGEKLVSRDE
ncbi:hypothetical protein [uncultured Mucilaginibacter sp.]|uniref:hypothetical protein n=1 Tax=uncultured Mucilaginibacter sp. TaxID=797541 RepID=UPI0026228169|nr:hypothetical protein [uncultured Mucilaginibacter sp.]